MFTLTLPIAILAFISGILFLYAGGEITVKGAASTAYRLGVKPVFVALTIVAYGTSLPELCVSSIATIGNHGEIAIGNILGSTITNLLLVFGVCAVIRDVRTEKRTVKQETFGMVISAGILLIFSIDTQISRFEGLIMIFLFVVYLVFFIRICKKNTNNNHTNIHSKPLILCIVYIFIGLVITVAGSYFLVTGAVFIAQTIKIPESVIALSLVALGTSLPELSISSVAMYRKQSGISVGTIIGSNIFNLLLITGVCGIIKPIHITVDLFLTAIISFAVCIIIVPVLYTGYKISRKEGIFLLALYTIYIVFLYLTLPLI